MTASLITALGAARRTGRPAPVTHEGLELGDAYGVQAALFADRGAALAGWKIGLTGASVREALGADQPAAGRLGPADILRSPAIAPIGAGEYYVEGELVFEIGERLSPADAPFTPAHIAAAVSGLYVGIELASSRFDTTDLSLGPLVADNCMADRLVLGDRIASRWEDRFADISMTLHGPDEAIIRGTTAAVMGNPLIAVTWLANWLARSGIALEPGQFVSSGTCTGVTAVFPGSHVTVDLSGMGGAIITFVAAS